MRFLTEEIRKEFHLLSAERQRFIQDCDLEFQKEGCELFILMVDEGEISLRVEEVSSPRD